MRDSIFSNVMGSLGYTTNEKSAFRKPNFITEFFKWLLSTNPKTRYPELWEAIQNTGVNLDSLFKGLASKQVGGLRFKPDREEIEDMIQDVLMQVVTEKTIKAWDGKADPVKYFGGMFSLRMINQVRDWVTRKTREEQEMGDSDDEERGTRQDELDRRDTRLDTNDNPLEGYVQTRDLLKGLSNFFKTKPQNQQEWLIPMLSDLIEGYSLTDIADNLGVSKTILSRRLAYLGQYIGEYAQKTGNELLKNLLQKYLLSKKHSFSAKDEDWLKLFSDYDKKKIGKPNLSIDGRSFEESVEGTLLSKPIREPSGEVRAITKKTMSDPYDNSTLSKALIESTISAEALQSAVGDSVKSLLSFEDIVELDSGELSALLSEAVDSSINSQIPKKGL